jgi:hypothetical protein
MALKKKGSEIFYENKIRMFVDEEVELKLGNKNFFPFTNIAKQSLGGGGGWGVAKWRKFAQKKK